MLSINIITAYKENIFIHQLNKSLYHNKIYFAENSHEDIVWDYVVVFQNLNHLFQGIRYKKGGLIFIAGEPECAEPYCTDFLNQFDYAIVPHPHKTHPVVIHTNPSLNWHFGRSYSQNKFKYNYEALSTLLCPVKDKNISMMCSNKTMMPGHVMRYQFYQLLSKEFKGQIDFYGAGIKLVDDKADILLPYRFHICIENSTDDHYWTEKIADPILGYSIPIYCGAPNITTYFPKDALVLIDINKPEEAVSTIKNLLEHAEEEYQRRLPALIEARKLLLDKYNLFPMLAQFVAAHPVSQREILNFNVRSYTEFFSWKVLNYKARLKRLIFKLKHKYIG